MGLGPSAFVAAAHIIMIAVLVLTSIRLMKLQYLAARPGRGAWLFPGPITLVLTAFAIERGYYVAARLLKPWGYDLWSMHPAPAALSSVVALSCYWLMPVIFRAQGMVSREVRITIAVEVVSFLIVGLAIGALSR